MNGSKFESATHFLDNRINATSQPESSRLIYIVSQVIDCILLAITLWILACLVTYGIRTDKWKKKTRKSNVDGGMIYTASVIAVALTLPRYIINQVVSNAIHIEGALQWCEIIMDIANVFYFVALYPIYFFLWLRQKALYGHPAMKKIAGKFVTAFSWMTVVVMSLAGIGVALLFILWDEYAATADGCILKDSIGNSSDSKGFSNQDSYFILVGLLLLAQIFLLGLFIYPMCKTNSMQNSRQSSKVNINEFKDDFAPRRKQSRFHSYVSTVRYAGRRFSTMSSTSSNNVQETVKRSVIFAAISMVSDIFTMAMVSLVIPTTVPRSLTNAFYNTSTLVSAICVVATFSNYRDILSVFCKRVVAKHSAERFSNSADDSKSSRQNSSV